MHDHDHFLWYLKAYNKYLCILYIDWLKQIDLLYIITHWNDTSTNATKIRPSLSDRTTQN